MISKADAFIKSYAKPNLPEIRPGDNVKVYVKIQEGKKEKIQIFEGKVLANKHNRELGATITVRKIVDGVGVEKIFPIHAPTIDRIEVVERFKTRRSKMYFLRGAKGKRSRLKKESLNLSSEKNIEEEQTPESKE
ncbi:MAG TPA: 50S ribosomal protein L19 [Candidatus Pacearchaeota archaeon]|nr:50S ribosomal protein L19 [Candidatus Pacearchaeota archaeon]